MAPQSRFRDRSYIASPSPTRIPSPTASDSRRRPRSPRPRSPRPRSPRRESPRREQQRRTAPQQQQQRPDEARARRSDEGRRPDEGRRSRDLPEQPRNHYQRGEDPQDTSSRRRSPSRARTPDINQEDGYDAPEEDHHEQNRGSKRRRRAQDVRQVQPSKSRRKKQKHPRVTVGQKVWKEKWRWIPRAIDAYANITTSFQVGIRADGLDDQKSPEVEEFLHDMDKTELAEYERVYRAILELAPGFEQSLESFYEDKPEALQELLREIHQACRAVTRDDRCWFKTWAPLLILKNPKTDAHTPPLSPLEKAGRGFYHTATGKLMCPQSSIKAFLADPTETLASLLDGTIAVTAKQWPHFLYNTDEYDPTNIDLGLLQGYYLLRCFIRIFISPSLALSHRLKPSPETANAATTNDRSKPKPSRPGNGKKNGLKAVTPHTIAYAATQAYFGICSMESHYDYIVNNFDLSVFYKRILLLFKDAEEPWCVETLDWWNTQVFGTAQSTASSGSLSDDGVDELEEIEQQRRNRRDAQSSPPASA